MSYWKWMWNSLKGVKELLLMLKPLLVFGSYAIIVFVPLRIFFGTLDKVPFITPIILIWFLSSIFLMTYMFYLQNIKENLEDG